MRIRKIKFIIIFLLLMLVMPCFALTLEGGIEYTEETARIEAFDGVSKYLTYPNVQNFNRSLFIANIENDDILKVIEYKARYLVFPFKLVGIIYKDEPNKLYTYRKQKNGYRGHDICVYDIKGNNVIKSANYNAQSGKLISVGLIVGDNEYKYDADSRKLLGHWKGYKYRTADKMGSAYVSNILEY